LRFGSIPARAGSTVRLIEGFLGVSRMSLASMVSVASASNSTVRADGRSLAADDDNHLFDKTKLCKFYVKGRCKRGKACSFAHSQGELLPQPDFYKTQLCPSFFETGRCEGGAGCKYAHDSTELRRSNKHKNAPTQAARPPTGVPAAAAPPAAAHAGRCDRAATARLEEAERDVQILKRKLQSMKQEPRQRLQSLTLTCFEPPMTKYLSEGSEDLNTGSFSRLSTQEPPAASSPRSEESLHYSVFGSVEPEPSSTHSMESLPWLLGSDEGEAFADSHDGRFDDADIEEMTCRFVVKNTFFILEPASVDRQPRSRSCPARGPATAVGPQVFRVSL